MNTENSKDEAEEPKPYRILSLDGGGAKGFYSLGVLKEIEGMIGCRLHEKFDLVFGTSTGAIIAALIALGYSVDEIHELYKAHVPIVMERKSASEKTKALSELAVTVFGEKKFDAVKTGVGIVTTKWVIERPMIFKGSVAQAHGRIGTFAPGFGCTIADAVEASCSAYPFFERKSVKPGKKALFIPGSGNRRDTDVLVCAQFRRYHKFAGPNDQKYDEGTSSC